MASEDLQEVMRLLEVHRRPPEAPVDERRRGWEDLMVNFPVPGDVLVEAIHADGVPADWVYAPDADPDRVVLYLHGGGYIICSPRTHRGLVAYLSRAASARVLIIDYRLAPENPFTAAVEDAHTAYRWLLGNGTSPEQIVIAGDSAGGGLAVATMFAIRDAGDPLPAAGICLSPWFNLVPEDPEEPLSDMAAQYLGSADPRSPLASPIYGDLSGLPPILIQVSADEPLVVQSNAFTNHARAAGVEIRLDPWDEMPHVWQMFAATLPEGRDAIGEMGAFVREHTG